MDYLNESYMESQRPLEDGGKKIKEGRRQYDEGSRGWSDVVIRQGILEAPRN